MFSRRARWIASTAVVLVVGGVAASVSATPERDCPLHFWMRDGQTRLFGAPDGEEIHGWDVSVVNDPSDGVIRARHSPIRALVRRLGVPIDEERAGWVSRLSTEGNPDGWHEWVARNVACPDDAQIDPDLVGDWATVSGVPFANLPSFESATLDAGGEFRIVGVGGQAKPFEIWPRYWSRSGDVVVVGCRSTDGLTVMESLVLDGDKRSLRTRYGWTARKVH